MSLNATVLFDLPQSEIASLLVNELRASIATSIVTGFATVEGMRAIDSPIAGNPASLQTLVVGAATYQAFEALDHLLAAGVQSDRIFVHLGHSRLTGGKAKYRFYRYHPMLHSKVYYMERADGTATAIIGSHNITGFALGGLNGEAAVLLRGPKDSPEFGKIREHIRHSRQQSLIYSQDMKEAYAWWAHQFFLGLSDKANDIPREGKGDKTIVILAEGQSVPASGDVVYFELPLALGTVHSLGAEIHLYLFRSLPRTPYEALRNLTSAIGTCWCKTLGIELERGGVELEADWEIRNHLHPNLEKVTRPFRPTRGHDMQQVRVKAFFDVRGKFEYFFERPTGWIPKVDSRDSLTPSLEIPEGIKYLGPNPENLDWHRVVGLEPASPSSKSPKDEAMLRLTPEKGSFVLMSVRRRQIEEIEEENEN